MTLSRNQKRYASILGACVLALAVDRLFLAPGAAEAGEQGNASPTPAARAAPTKRDPAPPVSITRKPLADRFAALAEEHAIDLATITDPFEVPWDAAPEVAVEPAVPPGLETFVKAHRLNAVLALEHGGYAIVDGRRLRIGEVLDGFQLVEIRPRSIILESPEFQRVELKLLDAGRPGGAPESIGGPQ